MDQSAELRVAGRSVALRAQRGGISLPALNRIWVWLLPLRRLRWTLPSAVFTALAVFFLWHAENGERGRLAGERKMEEIHIARADLINAQMRRQALERRVSQFRGDVIDADLLDERSRQLMGFVRRDEIVIPLDRNLNTK